MEEEKIVVCRECKSAWEISPDVSLLLKNSERVIKACPNCDDGVLEADGFTSLEDVIDFQELDEGDWEEERKLNKYAECLKELERRDLNYRESQGKDAYYKNDDDLLLHQIFLETKNERTFTKKEMKENFSAHFKNFDRVFERLKESELIDTIKKNSKYYSITDKGSKKIYSKLYDEPDFEFRTDEWGKIYVRHTDGETRL